MLTPEQEKQVEVIREQRAAADILSHQTYASQLKNLLAIVDDLRKQTGEQAEKIQAFSDEFAAMLTVERELQAKLKEQAETIEVNAKYCIELQGIIQEKAREIERLKKKHGTWEVEFRA